MLNLHLRRRCYKTTTGISAAENLNPPPPAYRTLPLLMPPFRSKKDQSSSATSSGDDSKTPLPSPPESKTKRK